MNKSIFHIFMVHLTLSCFTTANESECEGGKLDHSYTKTVDAFEKAMARLEQTKMNEKLGSSSPEGAADDEAVGESPGNGLLLTAEQNLGIFRNIFLIFGQKIKSFINDIIKMRRIVPPEVEQYFLCPLTKSIEPIRRMLDNLFNGPKLFPIHLEKLTKLTSFVRDALLGIFNGKLVTEILTDPIGYLNTKLLPIISHLSILEGILG